MNEWMNKWMNEWMNMHYASLIHIQSKHGLENWLGMAMSQMTRPPDTGLEIRVITVWGSARYLSVTNTPHNTDSLRVDLEETNT